MIKFISYKEVAFYKKNWNYHDLELLDCMGNFKPREDNWLIIDIRIMMKRGMFEFIKRCFPHVAKDKKHPIWAQLKKAYDDLFKKFHEKVYEPVRGKNNLYQHQLDCLMPMTCKESVLLALEQGCGKTLTSIYLSKALGIKRTIIICPAAVKWNWYDDLTRNFGFDDFSFTILDASSKRTVRALIEKYIIVNYEMIPKYMEFLCSEEVGHIIVDECQLIKSHKTGRYKSVEALRKIFPKAKLSLLSGTPIKNRVDDLFAYLKIMGHKLGQNKTKFIDTYTLTKQGKYGTKVIGARNVDDLFAKISNHVIRITSAECQDLPDLVINKYYFELNEYKAEYDKAIQEIIENKSEAFDINSSLHTLNIITCKSKLKGVIELAKDLVSKDRKVVIFCSYTEPLKALQVEFKKHCVFIDGSVNAHERMVRINKFKDDKNCTVFLGNMVAAGVGINLTNANDCIIINFPFSPADLEQAQKRLHRGGQKNKVNVYYTICKDAIDEGLFHLISDKASDITSIIDKGKAVVRYDDIPNKLFRELIKKYKKNIAHERSEA